MTRALATRVTTSAVLAIALVACGPPGTEGQLGNGVFQYGCVGPDSTCGSSAEKSPVTYGYDIPARIAVGSRFGLAYVRYDGYASELVRSASAEYVVAEFGPFRAARSGTVAMLALESSDGPVVDMTALQIVAPGTIEIVAPYGSTPESLTVGEARPVYALPAAADGTAIGGALAVSWTSSDPAVVSLAKTGSATTNTLRALAPGHADVVVASGAVTSKLAVEVH